MDNTEPSPANKVLRENLLELQDFVVQQASRLINDNLYTKSLLSSLPVALISTDKDGLIQVVNKTAEEMLQTKLGSLKNSSLFDLFLLSPEITEKIKQAREQEIPVSADSLNLILADGQQKVVNVHLRILYDEERRLFGTLLAMEDQTYLSFLRESFKQHALTPSGGNIIANSPKIKKVVKQLDELAKNDEPVLFSGPSGCGKAFLAAKLHKRRKLDSQAPLIMLDCGEIDTAKFKEMLFGSGDKLQDDKNFIRFKSLHDYGTIHLAEGGTLILRNIDALGFENLEAIFDYVDQVKEKSTALPKCRILATTKIDSAKLKQREEFFKPLLDRLLSSNVEVPALKNRRKDILPLAKLFLSSQDKVDTKSITRGAENGLLSKQYNQNNVKELKDAIELAVLVADGDIVRSEHIFTGPMEHASEYELDLTTFAPINFLISDRSLAILRSGVLAFFMVIIGFTLFFPNRIVGVIGNNLVWGAWWVFLVIGFLLIGRVWCTVCPLSTAGRVASRIWNLAKSPPEIIKNSSYFLIPIGFVGIMWLEQIFHMTVNPKSTGFLLLGLIFLAVVFAIIFKRETWCRYICPLGNFGSIFALSATLFVRSNPNVCSTKCTTHNCNKGSEEYAGCPVFHHPLFARNAHICKLCFNCLKSCPHGSAKLYLRPPLIRIWQQLDIEETISYFAFAFFFFAPCLLASERISIFMGPRTFSLAAIASLGFAAICRYKLPKQLFGDDERKQLNTTRLTLVLLLLAWGPFAAFQFGHIPSLGSLSIISGTFDELKVGLLKPGVPLLYFVQLAAIWFGALIAVVTLFGLSIRVQREGASNAWRNSYFFLGICIAYSLLNSWIVL